MTFEEMKQRLTNIQNDSTETKMLNSILICFAEIKNLEKNLIDTQNKINEIINALNNSEAKENIAETVNLEEDALVNEPDPRVSEEDK